MLMRMTYIGEVVRRWRKARGMTLEQLANTVSDYDAGNLSRFERGLQGVEEGKLREIASALQVPVSTLYAEVEGIRVPPTHEAQTNKITGGGAPTPSTEAIDLAIAIESLPATQRAALRAVVDSVSHKKSKAKDQSR